MPDVRLALTAIALFVAMAICAWLGRRSWGAIAALVLLCWVWFTFDAPFEGRNLIKLSPTSAVTEADVVGLVGLLVAGALAMRLWVRRRR